MTLPLQSYHLWLFRHQLTPSSWWPTNHVAHHVASIVQLFCGVGSVGCDWTLFHKLLLSRSQSEKDAAWGRKNRKTQLHRRSKRRVEFISSTKAVEEEPFWSPIWTVFSCGLRSRTLRVLKNVICSFDGAISSVAGSDSDVWDDCKSHMFVIIPAQAAQSAFWKPFQVLWRPAFQHRLTLLQWQNTWHWKTSSHAAAWTQQNWIGGLGMFPRAGMLLRACIEAVGVNRVFPSTGELQFWRKKLQESDCGLFGMPSPLKTLLP